MKKIDDFFKSPSEKSKVKTNIAVEYFSAWVNILKKTCTYLTYIDLFSGVGVYQDGTKSTPLRILDEVEKNPDIQDKIKLYFYEEKPAHFNKLVENIKKHPVYHLLKFEPEINLTTVDRNLIERLPINDCTFTFIDPYGNKNYSTDLLNACIRKWGSDCLFYLNSQGIIRNLNNSDYEPILSELFGQNNIPKLRKILKEKQSTLEKHKEIYKILESNLSKGKKLYFCEFGIEFEERKNISHFLVFISKSQTGFDKMRNIMNKYSLKDSDKFPLFVYSTKTNKNGYQGELQLNDGRRLLVSFSHWLAEEFSSVEITYESLTNKCLERGVRYTNVNIGKAIRYLYEENKVDIRRKNGEFKGKQIRKKDVIIFKKNGD